MKYYTATALLATTFLYTKSPAIAAPPPELPCQKISILGKSHKLCWTFDDHPLKYTPDILKVLRQHNIRATFFVVGWPLQYYARYPHQKHPQLYLNWFNLIVKDKHLIGIHGLTHGNLCKMPKRKMRQELVLTKGYIKRFGGTTATLWRAPFLVRCRMVNREARRLKLVHVPCHVQDYRRTAKQMWMRLRWRVLHDKTYSIILIHMNACKLCQFLRLIKKHP